VELAAGRPAEAETGALRAVELAQSLDVAPDKAIALRVLGQIFTAQGQYARAHEALAESVACLGDSDPYELARSKMQWGLALLAAGDQEAGQSRLQKAHKILRKLGAGYELAELGKVLAG